MTVPVTFDAHSDLPFRVVREREAGRRAVVASDFAPGMRAGGIGMRVASIYLDDPYVPERALHRALVVASELRADVAESDGVELATTADAVAAGAETDARTLVLGMEGAEPLGGDPRVLDAFYRLGLRVLTLTHSRRNALGEGVPLSGDRRGTPGGLSEAGVAVVERADELGIVVDLSHLNAPGVDDALATSDRPVIASHSNCRALWDHPRNLTDDQIRAIAATEGVVCLTAVGSFLGDSPDVETVCDHVEHAVDVAGVSHVGLGFDFYDYLTEYLSDPDRAHLEAIPPVDGLAGDEAVATLARALERRGFSDREIAGICRTNLQRVFERVLE
ncbi:dipeptidase [Halovivax cerinus]|uniref:Dipeptidase n=1 Tax=Halovivax cerinus TaxID=1487865 RepID=A0ABD5NQ59_9EURY|nr:membrane dipeptidase [Halovivax cerinus]